MNVKIRAIKPKVSVHLSLCILMLCFPLRISELINEGERCLGRYGIGNCKLLANCPAAVHLAQKGISPVFCRVERQDIRIVCCEEPKTKPTQTRNWDSVTQGKGDEESKYDVGNVNTGQETSATSERKKHSINRGYNENMYDTNLAHKQDHVPVGVDDNLQTTSQEKTNEQDSLVEYYDPYRKQWQDTVIHNTPRPTAIYEGSEQRDEYDKTTRRYHETTRRQEWSRPDYEHDRTTRRTGEHQTTTTRNEWYNNDRTTRRTTNLDPYIDNRRTTTRRNEWEWDNNRRTTTADPYIDHRRTTQRDDQWDNNRRTTTSDPYIDNRRTTRRDDQWDNNRRTTTSDPYIDNRRTTTRRNDQWDNNRRTTTSDPYIDNQRTTTRRDDQWDNNRRTTTSDPYIDNRRTTTRRDDQWDNNRRTTTSDPYIDNRRTTTRRNDQWDNNRRTTTSDPYIDNRRTTTRRTTTADPYIDHRRTTTRRDDPWDNNRRTTTSDPYIDKRTTTKRDTWSSGEIDQGSFEDSYTRRTTKRPKVTHRPTARPQKPPKQRISEIKCREYSKQVTDTISGLPLTTDPKPVQIDVAKCLRPQRLIVGGENTTLGEFPHMAALGYRDPIHGGVGWLCGGSLISDQFILTAAHCTSTSSGPPVIVRLGELNLKRTDDGANPVDYYVQEIIRHPQYTPPIKYNDIALLKLSSRVGPHKNIRPACLYTKEAFTTIRTTATGWGRIAVAEDPSDVLLKVDLNIIDGKTCRNLYEMDSKTEQLSRGIIESQLCAGELKGGKDTCQGDSGGPIEVTSESNECIHHIIGVTSFGKSCALANAPGIYTRVSSYIPWIESIVWPQHFTRN